MATFESNAIASYRRFPIAKKREMSIVQITSQLDTGELITFAPAMTRKKKPKDMQKISKINIFLSPKL